MNVFMPPLGAAAGARRPGIFARVIGAVAAVILLASVVLFSAVLLVVLLVVGAVGLGWFWWQTRAARRILRERVSAHGAQTTAGDGVVGGMPDGRSRGAVQAASRAADISDAEIISEVQVRNRL